MICIDELGPLSAKTYPGAEWKRGPHRATFEPDYGRRGKCWVHGAFEPATGEATMAITGRRDSKSHIRLLERMVEVFPSERWLIIEDNLSTHHSKETQVALLAWPEIQVQFIPRYACWLNLIEPWWKQLRSLALKGRQFETVEELKAALWEALAWWNAHRRPYVWKKIPQKQEDCAALWETARRLGGYGSSLVHKTIMTSRKDHLDANAQENTKIFRLTQHSFSLDMKNLLLTQFDLHHRLYNNVLDGFTDAQSNQRLYDDTNINHVKYLAGHLLNSRYGLAALADVPVERKWNKMFAVMGRSEAKDDFPYPDIEAIKAEWNGISDRIREGLDTLTPEALNDTPPAPFDQVADSKGELWAFINHHEAYHIGQIAILRRGFGKEPMRYD